MRRAWAGDVWEAENRVFYIVKVLRQGEETNIEYLELTEENGNVHHVGHLTIRASVTHGFSDLWQRIA
jgi:hypothetical protein